MIPSQLALSVSSIFEQYFNTLLVVNTILFKVLYVIGFTVLLIWGLLI